MEGALWDGVEWNLLEGLPPATKLRYAEQGPGWATSLSPLPVPNTH